MHNVDRVSEGRFLGWISGDANGRPSHIDLSFGDRKIRVFAVRERVDVLRAGFTRFSGFAFSISAYSREFSCRAVVEGSEYKITPVTVFDTDLIKIDEVGRDHVSGWVNRADGLRSLTFFCASGMTHAEIHERPDVNAHLNTPSERLHGFRAQGLDVSGLFAVSINHSAIHWVAPGWLACRV